MQDGLVTGGTGVLGRVVVDDLLGHGHRVRVLTRRTGIRLPDGASAVTGDLATGAGLTEAVTGAGTIVHCASDFRRYAKVDVVGTRRLVEAATAAGNPHLIFVSIVGCDQIPYGYYRTKTQAELVVAESGLPWTVLRATQFHDLILAAAHAVTRLPLIPLPKGLRDQPVDVRDVAPRLRELVDGGPAGRAPDVGGPQVLTAAEIVRAVADACGRRARLITVPGPGKVLAGFRAGHHLCPDHAVAGRTFADYLAERVHRDGDKISVDVPYRRRS